MDNEEQAEQQNPGAIPQDDVAAARKMFYGGFALLPFLWLVNYVHYRKELNNPEAPPAFKKHVKGSLLGFGVFVAVWAVWLAFFYQNTGDGEWGDSLKVVNSETDVL